VIPNKYPALSIEGSRSGAASALYDRMRGIGAHEVVIEHPSHTLHMADMERAHLEKVLWLYQERLRDLSRDGASSTCWSSRTTARRPAATLDHPHTQIIGTPVTPRAISMELESARQHYHLKERCLLLRHPGQELEARDRLVTLDEHFAVFAPYASRFPSS
jgi:UDPglucose--hexose-1-phosphate uridylyltransferase